MSTAPGKNQKSYLRTRPAPPPPPPRTSSTMQTNAIQPPPPARSPNRSPNVHMYSNSSSTLPKQNSISPGSSPAVSGTDEQLKMKYLTVDRNYETLKTVARKGILGSECPAS